MKKKLSVSIIVLIASLSLYTVTDAYVLKPYHWSKSAGSTQTVQFKYSTSNSTYRATFNTAVSDWNSRQSKIYYSLSDLNASAVNTVGTEYIADQSHYGITHVSYSVSSGLIYTAEVLINIGNSDVVNKSNTRRSAANHELGHALGLDHTTPPVLSVMNSSRDRETVYTPQTDDINGVNAIYPF
ncbi:M57 family metalloprotease [Paenibacillus sp. BAC0078]